MLGMLPELLLISISVLVVAGEIIADGARVKSPPWLYNWNWNITNITETGAFSH